MTGFESNVQRQGFNDTVGVVRLEAQREAGPFMDKARFTTRVVQPALAAEMGTPLPPVNLTFDINALQAESLQRLDRSGQTGIGTNALGGDNTMQVLRNDGNGITLSTTIRAGDGRNLPAEITFASADINHALESLTAKNDLPPRFDAEPERDAVPGEPQTYRVSF